MVKLGSGWCPSAGKPMGTIPFALGPGGFLAAGEPLCLRVGSLRQSRTVYSVQTSYLSAQLSHCITMRMTCAPSLASRYSLGNWDDVSDGYAECKKLRNS